MSNTISTSDEFSHTTVLLPETVAMVLGVKQLNDVTSKVSGVYVDATFGRGGHSQLLLEYLAPEATLAVFDKDPEAIAVAKSLAAQDTRIKVVHDSFAHLTKNLQALGIDKIDGLMADLGVSSPQLDDGTRGFSFMRDGVVDMRMDTTRGEPVSEWLQRVSADELADVLYEYGEERHSRKIARAIKSMQNYTSTRQLAEVIKQAHPAWQKANILPLKAFKQCVFLLIMSLEMWRHFWHKVSGC